MVPLLKVSPRIERACCQALVKAIHERLRLQEPEKFKGAAGL